MNSGILVTEDGIGKARSIYDRMSALDHLSNLSLLRKYQSGLFEQSSDFDDFYAAIYALRISGLKTALASEKETTENLVPKIVFEIMSDISVGGKHKGVRFEETLLNEFAVSDLAYLKSAVNRLIPLTTKLVALETGCIYMKFNILASPQIQLNSPSIPGFSKEIVENSEKWDSLFKQFKVKSFNLSLA